MDTHNARRAWWVAALCLVCGCGESGLPAPLADGGVVADGGQTNDAGVSDAGVNDAGVNDAGVESDAGVSDAGVSDAGVSDAGVSDAGVNDAGVSDAGLADGGACGACSSYGASASVGNIAETALNELSGLAASRLHPHVLYAHNDSGDTARFFAMRDNGEALGRFNLAGATAVDWEDLAVGPCPQGSCIYIGDIGDNSVNRTNTVVYRTAEPSAASLAPGATTSVTFDAFPFAYPDGAHNAEALLVHPTSGQLYVLTKESALVAQTRVYRFPTPLRAGERVTLEYVTTVSLPRGLLRVVTAATVHPCAPRILLRTYDRVFELRGTVGASFESIFAATPIDAPVPSELQGEAIEYRADGLGFFTASEGVGGALHASSCQ